MSVDSVGTRQRALAAKAAISEKRVRVIDLLLI